MDLRGNKPLRSLGKPFVELRGETVGIANRKICTPFRSESSHVENCQSSTDGVGNVVGFAAVDRKPKLQDRWRVRSLRDIDQEAWLLADHS